MPSTLRFVAPSDRFGYSANMLDNTITQRPDARTAAAAADYKILSPETVAAKAAAREDVFILDLRDGRDWARGHIPEAVSLPADVFAERHPREVDPDDEIILVCERGLTSEAAAKFLASQGFSDVATMAGGMNAYDGPLQTR